MTVERQREIQFEFLALMVPSDDRTVKRKLRLNRPRAIDRLAKRYGLSVRVIADIINRRGAYAKGGFSVRQIHAFRGWMAGKV